MTSVLQPWVMELPLKMQSALFSCLRGAEIREPAIKHMAKWMRGVLQVNADPETTYMKVSDMPDLSEYADALEYTTLHYALHTVHSLQIIGAYLPGEAGRKAVAAYAFLVDYMHLNVENINQLERRLGRSQTLPTTVSNGIINFSSSYQLSVQSSWSSVTTCGLQQPQWAIKQDTRLQVRIRKNSENVKY